MNFRNSLLILIIAFGTFIPSETKKTKIAFFINYLSVRGTEVSTFDYADFNETLLGNESIIIINTEYDAIKKNEYSITTKEKFLKRFEDRVFFCSTMDEVNIILRRENVDIFYAQKAGGRDNKVSRVCRNAMHAVFPEIEVHGDVYACISSWLSKVYPSKRLPFVPYMVRLPDISGTLHEELHIPQGAVVFGRHGGYDAFDIPFARQAVEEIAKRHKDWYFVFLSTEKFCNLSNVIFLPLTADMEYKTKFINTCDVMIHARDRGETFGLACAEFSIKNKAVMTWNGSPERNHIDVLGKKGLYYNNKEDLLKLLTYCGENIDEIRSKNWDAYSRDYNPVTVMNKFNEVFILPLIK